MKRSIRIFSLILVCITMLCLFGCSGGNETTSDTSHFFIAEELRSFPHDSYVYDYHPVQSYESNVILLSSKQQVDDLFSATYSSYWSTPQDNWIRTSYFTDVINKFNENFFESKQVLTFFTTAASSANYFKLKGISYQTGKLIVKLDHLSTVKEMAQGTGTSVNHFAIIEIQKVEPNTQIEIKILGRNW